MNTHSSHKGEIVESDGYLYYCLDGVPTHAGVVLVDGKIYYAGHEGELVCGHHKVVHRDRANGLLKRGTYEFDEDGVLVEGSYQKPARSKPRRSSQGLPGYFRKILTAGLLILAALAAAFVLYLTRSRSDETAPAAAGSSGAPASTEAAHIQLPESGRTVWLVSDELRRVYDGSMTLTDAAARTGQAGAPFVFSYSMEPDDHAVLELAGQSYPLDPLSGELEIPNLETGRTYDYTVTVSGDWGSETHVGRFHTADSNRMIQLDGLKNTRDIGGYETLDGKRVRQGQLIRGSELDGLTEPTYYLQDPAQAEPFGFRYDCDLRSGSLFTGEYVSRLGARVGHAFFGAPAYGEIFQEYYFPALRELFSALADAAHYPMYLHCTYGADRTGTLVFLLQGILGVPEEQMCFEYHLTCFTFPQYAANNHINVVINGLAGYPGKTINEKIEAYLTGTVGIPAEQLDSIRAILLEPAGT